MNGELATIIRDAINETRQRIISEFDYIDGARIDETTIEEFSDYITRERLRSMPHRGSLWDRVLRWAEFYALQVAAYAENIVSFVPESYDASKHVFVLLRSLLEHGEENAGVLNTTFGVFYKLGLSLAFLNSYETRLSLNTHIRKDVGRAFHDIHSLVFNVASYYQRTVRGLSSGSVRLDFTGLFRENLDRFYARKRSIIDHMWRHALGDSEEKDVPKIRKWLDQRSSLLNAISANSYSYQSQYDEYTCEWFQRHLVAFTRSSDEVLAITAPAGCGKTILSSWIQERLQRPIDRKAYSTLIFSFEADLPSETTSPALAKNLALQLMNIRVGDAAMFNLVREAYSQKSPAAIETRLWAAIDAGFSASSQPTMIIIDGLDQLQGENLDSVCETITKLSKKHTSLKSIILSRPNTALLTSNQKWKTFEIKPDDVYEDIRHIAKHTLQRCEQYRIQKEAEQQVVIDQLVKAANGSFLWLLLTSQLLERSKSIEDFGKNMREVPKTLDSVIQKHVGYIDFSDSDLKMLISILLIAERPLTLGEIYEILQVDVQKRTISKRQIDVAEKISKTNGLLGLNETEVVKFRHSAVRRHLLSLQAEGKKILGFKDAQTQFTLRLLVYIKASLTNKRMVSLEKLPYSEVQRTYTDRKLLEYSVQNWIVHFPRSSLYSASGPLQLSSEFKSLFPNSTYLVLLEWTCWNEQSSKHELIDMYELSLRIRSEVFDERHECTLQNVITCGFVHHEYSPTTITAEYFFRATSIAQQILDKFSKATIACASTFLAITETMKFASREKLATWREETLKFVILAYKHEHGETSEIVLRYYKLLADLYLCINEEENATLIWKEIRLLVVKKHGEGSVQDREVMDRLMIVLKGKKDAEIEKYCSDIFAVNDDQAIVWDEARISMILQLASACEHRKELFEAEEFYVTLWNRLLHFFKEKQFHDIDLRIRVLQIAVEYTNFLQRCGRHDEAKNILIIVWTEYQHFGCESVAFYLQLKVIGETMRAIGLLTLAVSIFEKISQWFKAVGKHDHEELVICEGYVLEIFEEIANTEATQKEETTEEIETIIRKTFSSTTVVTKEYIKITRLAVQLYIKKDQWADAISVLTKSLRLLWIESSWGGDICLPKEFVDESIEFAIALGKCHMKCKHYHESLSCYLQLWQAVRNCCGFHDKRRKLVVDILVGFYTEHRRWKLLIELRKELLMDYCCHLGNAHHDTISILYLLADLVLEHGHGQAEDYYREIIEVIGETNTKSSFKAYKLICQIYYDEGRWLQLKDICDVLWRLLIHHHKDYEFDAEFVELLYARYMYVLRHHYNHDHKSLLEISLQYMKICDLKFGSSSSVSLRARMEYAALLMEAKGRASEAITIYEEIITISNSTKTTVSESSMTTIKKHLAEAYIYVHKHESVSANTIQRAVQVLQERFEYLKITLGCSYRETLHVLMELSLMRLRLKSSNFEQTIIQQLQEVIIDILSNEKRPQILFQAASILGSIYATCGLTHHGLQLMQKIRRQVVAIHIHGSQHSLNIDKSVGRLSFVFLVAFELTLDGSVCHNYSEIMADCLTESVLYDSYHRCFHTQTKFEVLLTRSARLRAFWKLHSRDEDIIELEQSVSEVFYKQFNTIIKTTMETAKIFIVSILSHLASHDAYNSQLIHIASAAGNAKVSQLLSSGNHQQAHEVGQCIFRFVVNQGSYHEIGIIGYGFDLAGYMAGRGTSGIPAELRPKMLQTSREIMTKVLEGCKDLDIQFSHLHDHELNNLVALLGEQENYAELEIILESLWKSRHQQKHWSEDTLINLGKYLIASRHLANGTDGHSHPAIHLAEDISYNLRRVLGGLYPLTLEISSLLSQLYTDAKKYGDAISVHEEILQLIVSGGDSDDRTIDVVSPATARLHLDLLKAAYQRNGKWVKSASTYEDLVHRLLSIQQFTNAPEFRNVQQVEAWKRDEAVSQQLGTFVKPSRWELIVKDDIRASEEKKHVHTNDVEEAALSLKKEKPIGWNFRRLSENWGMSFGAADRAKLVY
ncbi:hypothetical protein B0O99DRAFT_518287 [Bisporella sp. PMI_857]|nr:hypothetical protein B0O99DRAFT_518287 [Bisporella sp. PMI_857]